MTVPTPNQDLFKPCFPSSFRETKKAPSIVPAKKMYREDLAEVHARTIFKQNDNRIHEMDGGGEIPGASWSFQLAPTTGYYRIFSDKPNLCRVRTKLAPKFRLEPVVRLRTDPGS